MQGDGSLPALKPKLLAVHSHQVGGMYLGAALGFAEVGRAGERVGSGEALRLSSVGDDANPGLDLTEEWSGAL